MDKNKSQLPNSPSNDHPQDEMQWLDGTIPHSTRFGDSYYSKLDGLGETGHVFINGNNLSDRFKTAQSFTIAETGFGTGLNFLATSQLWSKTAARDASLKFISFELYPMSAHQMAKALSRWPKLNQTAQLLCNNFSQNEPVFVLSIDNISLEVHFGDANTVLPNLALSVDAWFLDGFAPSRNPQLWNSELMNQIFMATKAEGTFATYTAAGWVRRNLMGAGFNVERLPGYLGKREMMAGYKSAKP